MHGSIEVITGPMFSGKSDELIRRLRAAQGDQQVIAFKPQIDTRYSDHSIAAHNGHIFPAIPIPLEGPMHRHLQERAMVVGVDEAQFFDEWFAADVLFLAYRGARVILSGLDLTYIGKPFGVMPHLLAIADQVTKLRSVCAKCGGAATRTFRTTTAKDAILVGGAESYQPRCLSCFTDAL